MPFSFQPLIAWNGLLCADVPLRNCSLTYAFLDVTPTIDLWGSLSKSFTLTTGPWLCTEKPYTIDMINSDNQRQRRITHCLAGHVTTHSSGSGFSTPVPMVLSRQQAYTPAVQLGALNNIGGRSLLSPRHLPFVPVTQFLNWLLLIYQPWKGERLSWPVKDQRSTTMLRRRQSVVC